MLWLPRIPKCAARMAPSLLQGTALTLPGVSSLKGWPLHYCLHPQAWVMTNRWLFVWIGVCGIWICRLGCSHTRVQVSYGAGRTGLGMGGEGDGPGAGEWLCSRCYVLAQKSSESENSRFEPRLPGSYGYTFVKGEENIFHLIVFSLLYNWPLFVLLGGPHKW